MKRMYSDNNNVMFRARVMETRRFVSNQIGKKNRYK